MGLRPAHVTEGLTKRSFSLSGHRTSVALEPEFWTALEQLAASRSQRLSALVAHTDATRPPGQPLASALRVLALLCHCEARASGLRAIPCESSHTNRPRPINPSSTNTMARSTRLPHGEHP